MPLYMREAEFIPREFTELQSNDLRMLIKLYCYQVKEDEEQGKTNTEALILATIGYCHWSFTAVYHGFI